MRLIADRSVRSVLRPLLRSIWSRLRFLLSALQVQAADHSQKIEKTEEGGRKAACGFGEIGETCDFTGPREGLAEFEVALANP